MISAAAAGPLVGRDYELEQLDRALAELDRGGAACLAIEGEAGIGKTRLLGELRARAQERRFELLAGVAAEFEQDLPYSVLVDALDAYVLSHDLEQRVGWDAELERELAVILPSLGGDGRATGLLADERYRAHRALRRLLAMIAEDRPLVLTLDDLQWSDGASIEVIAALVRRRLPARTLLALGFRPGRTAERLAGALADPQVTTLALRQLTEAEAGLVLDGEDPRAVSAIYRLAGGNPFYLEQLGRAGAGSASVGASAAETTGVPPAVAAAIAAELASVPAAVRRLLDAAAVAGEPFELDLATSIAELPESDGLAALDELLDRDLVRPTDVPRRFVFRHPLMRRAVYETTRVGWRLSAHGRAAAVLASAGRPAADRAHHVEHSAAPGDEAAIDVLLEAGRAAVGRAPATAVRWFEAALRLLPGADARRQVAVRVELAGALRSAGELERCRDALLEAQRLLGPDAAEERVELTAHIAAVEHWQGRHAEAHRRLRRAWEELPDRGTPGAAALQVELAVDGLYDLDLEQTFEMGQAALATARGLADPGLVAMAAAALALGEGAAGRAEAAREHRDEALGQMQRMEEAEIAARLETFYYLGWAENYLERYSEAIAHAERGIALARETGEGRLLVPLMLLRCYPLEMQGRLAVAREICETAVEISRLSANPHFLSWALFELGWVRYYAGDLDGAIAAGEESIRVGGRATGGTMPSAGGGSGWTLAVATFELGEAERARRMMYEICDKEMAKWVPAERYFNWENLALAELALGDRDAAEAVTRMAEEAAAAVPLRLPTALARRTRAAVQLAAGDSGGAARAAEEAVTAALAIGATLQAAFARSLLGRALARTGDTRRAIAELRTAESELDACGSVGARDEVRRQLHGLSGPPLIRTKLLPPVPRGMVARPGALAALLHGGPRRLSLIRAPAGWGKSSLAAAWAAEDPRPFAWVALDVHDSTPERFFAYAIAALRSLAPVVGERSMEILVAGGGIVDEVLPALIDELAALREPAVLVLDDYHLIADAEVHDAIAILLEQAPDLLELALLSHTTPPLPLPRLRERGELVEVTVDELRFGRADAQEVLNQSQRLALAPEDIDRLVERTEGWPAGLYLAALALRGHGDAQAAVARMTGDDRHVVDHLADGVLVAQPLDAREFLLSTCMLERLCAPLCDAVTGRDDAAEVLRRMEASNLFLVPIDGDREWYRYHRLFADLLRLELARRDATELHRRAAAWHLEHGLVSDAVRHYVAAGDVAHASEAIAGNWIGAFACRGLHEVSQWLDRLPADAPRLDARLGVARAAICIGLGRIDEVAGWVEAIGNAPFGGPSHDGFLSPATAAACLRGVHLWLVGDVGGALASAEAALRRDGVGAPGDTICLMVSAAARYWLDDTERGHREIERALARAREGGFPPLIIWCLGMLASVHVMRGEPEAARSLAEEAIDSAERHGLTEHWIGAIAHTELGQVLLASDRVAEARDELERGLELARRGSGAIGVTHALLALSEARPAERRGALLEEARSILQRCPDPGPLASRRLRAERIAGDARRPAATLDEPFSEREIQVLRMLAGPLSQREIGSELFISVNTVKSHTKAIYRKLGAAGRGDAVVRARELGLL